MRVGVACLMQESNSFAPSYSTLENFQIDKGQELVASNQGTNTEVGGFLEELECLNLEAVPLISAWALAAGPIEDEAFDRLTRLLCDEACRAEVDGLLLALHGAWTSPSYASADAELVRRIREKIGRDIPVVVTLDFHANVRPSLVNEVQALVGYRTYPHVDMAETGRKAARLLHQILVRNLHPYMYWLPIPLLAPPQSATTENAPIKEVIQQLDRDFAAGDFLSSSFFCVQPWLDIGEVSSSLVVVASSADPRVPLKMRRLAQWLWNQRAQFEVEWTAPDDLVERVLREKSRPVIVSEAYDGTTGGAPGDHPGLLSLLLPHRTELSASLFMVDSEAALQAHQFGIGREFHGIVGAKNDKRFGPPIGVRGRVCHASDGAFLLKGPVFTGKKVEMGPTAVLELGRLKVVVGSRAVIAVDPELYRSQQIEPREQDLVAVKSPTLFRPGYASMLGAVLHLDMPGVCRGNLEKVPFSKFRRPLWPLNDFQWDASKEALFAHSSTN
jgi:microcystin degradation protein MlrC